MNIKKRVHQIDTERDGVSEREKETEERHSLVK